MNKEFIAKQLVLAAKDLVANEDEATDELENIVGVQGAFKLMKIWKIVNRSSNLKDHWGKKKDPLISFITKAKNDGFNDKAIKHYVENIQERRLPRNWKRMAGCEKLPEGGMRENCEKKVEEGKKDDKKASRRVEGLDKNKAIKLTMLKLLNKAMGSIPNSPQQKKIINKLNVYRKDLGLKPLTANASRVGRLVKRHEKLLDKWARSREGQRHIGRFGVLYDDLPVTLLKALERIKDTETLWSDVERYLGDIQAESHSFVKPLWGCDE